MINNEHSNKDMKGKLKPKVKNIDLNANVFLMTQETKPNTDASKFDIEKEENINNIFSLSKTKTSKVSSVSSTPLRLDSQDLIDIFLQDEFEFDDYYEDINSLTKPAGLIKDYFKIIDVLTISKNEKIIRCAEYTTKDEESENIIKSPSDNINSTNKGNTSTKTAGAANKCNQAYINLIKVKLKGLWAEVMADPDDIVFVCAEYNREEDCYLVTDRYNNIDKKNSSNSGADSFEILKNFFIIEPETLISPSRIKTAFPCLRKSIFGEQFTLITNGEQTGDSTKNSNPNSSRELIVGSIVHEVFQIVVRNCTTNSVKISKEYVEGMMEKIIKNYYLDIALENFDIKEMNSIIKSYVTNIIKFFEQFFMKRRPIHGIKIKKYNTSEKVYQSQVLGMKGVIDMLVQTDLENSKDTEITPVELKTGNGQNNADLMQVLVYCLILSEQLEKDSYNGILVYLKKDSQIRIKVKQNDIINVFVVRNNIAKMLKKMNLNANSYSEALPQLYRNKSECERCYQKEICYFHYVNNEKRKELENFLGKDKIPQNKENFDKLRNFLNKENLSEESLEGLEKYFCDSDTLTYFNYFYSIINEEETHNHIHKKIHIKDGEIADLQEFKKYKIETIKDKENSYDITIFSVEDDAISLNKIDSLDEIQSQFIYLNDGYHIYEPIHKKSFQGVLVHKHDDNSSKFTLNILKSYMYKMKKSSMISFWDDIRINIIYLKNINNKFKYPFRLMRGNLMATCLNFRPKLKDSIIHLTKPNFNFDCKSEIANYITKHFEKEFKYMNLNQKTALLKAFVSEDYTCIIGFPGSGKTTLISLLVSILAKMKKRILIVAHTNLAVDNILIKIKEKGVDFVRVTNNVESVLPEIRDKVLRSDRFDDFSKWKEYLNGLYVYGVTTLGISNKMIVNNNYDYCIVDEACQIFEPNLLGPLLLCKKFVLVGDPFQLPALIKSNTAPPSLFERLIDKYPEISVQLNDQYRMNMEILKLSNECVYQNIMKCANNEVATQKLKIDLDLIENYQIISNNNWLRTVLDPDRPVIFVDYSDYINKERPEFFNSSLDSNVIECDIIVKIINALKYANYDVNNVGIITPYKAQENLLYSNLTECDFYNVFTIDKSQGLEKEVIIVSFVKNNKRTKLLKDIARINVAFTRPKSKLIIVGLIECLIEIEKLKNYIDVIKREGWCYKIDKV